MNKSPLGCKTFCLALCLACQVENATGNDSKRRKKYKTSEQSELHGVSVSLGRKHTSYHIVPKTAVWKELLVHASAFDEKFSHGLGLPQSHAEVQAFIEAVDLFFARFSDSFWVC